jgi:hypothetical protein
VVKDVYGAGENGEAGDKEACEDSHGWSVEQCSVPTIFMAFILPDSGKVVYPCSYFIDDGVNNFTEYAE